MRRETMVRRLAVLIPCCFLFLGLGQAEAANVACFTWNCDHTTGFCTFDANCTQNDGSLWRYRWNFGDGSGLTFTGSPTISHQYSGPPCIYPQVVLTVIDYDVSPFSTQCEIVQKNCVGPPRLPYGQCSG